MAAETPMAGAPRTIMSRMTVGDLLVVGREDVGLFEGKLGLIEEVNAGGEPFEGRNHVLNSFRRCRLLWG